MFPPAVALWLPDCVRSWPTFCANACCGIAPIPIKDIADSSTAAVANIASFGHFRFFSPEFPVERRFIVEVHTLMVNMRYGLVFSIKIQNLKPNFIVMKNKGK
jgi:hypothetical protein